MRHTRIRIVLASPVSRLVALATLVIVALVATPSLGRAPVAPLDALPRVAERLGEPIWLRHCGMRVVEWRPTAALTGETTPGEKALAVMDAACRDAFDHYGPFLRVKGLRASRSQPDILPTISLLPGNVLLDGKTVRALNDLPSRFESVAPGCCYWGLYVDSLNHLFLRNDPLIKNSEGALETNPRFVRTLTHEISHILSSRLGVWDVIGYDRQRDEDLAEDFVAFMGMRFPAESSAEDLAFHEGRAPYTPPPSPTSTARATRVFKRAKPQETPSPSASANTSEQL